MIVQLEYGTWFHSLVSLRSVPIKVRFEHSQICYTHLIIIGPVTCLDYNDKMLLTGSSDKYVCMIVLTCNLHCVIHCTHGAGMSKHGAVIHIHNLE